MPRFAAVGAGRMGRSIAIAFAYAGHRIAPENATGRFPSDEEARVAAGVHDRLERTRPAAGFGSLASGGDVLVAEALLARGAELHVLLPFAVRRFRAIASPRVRRESIVGGLLAGVAMTFGSSLQQVGMHSTTASNAGFITGLYVIIVPMLGLFVGQRVGWPVWWGAVLAVAGLFFLSLYDPEGGSFAINAGDLWVLGCAFAWSFHVQIIGWAAREADPFVISVVQFAVTGLVALAVSQALAFAMPDSEWGAREAIDLPTLRAVLGPLLFATLLSTCIAFTLQTVAQGSAPPAHAVVHVGVVVHC